MWWTWGIGFNYSLLVCYPFRFGVKKTTSLNREHQTSSARSPSANASDSWTAAQTTAPSIKSKEP